MVSGVGFFEINFFYLWGIFVNETHNLNGMS